ncbi:MAG: MFS transporter [Gemmatimonadales bacterium]|nr:MFS transporter [Gemmatimonadales bacterium]
MLPLFLIVFLDLVGFGMVLPVFPFYAERVGVPPSLVIFLGGLYSLGQLIGAPLWGALSDRVGRKPILLLTLLANAAANLVLAVADSGPLLGASRLIGGLAAGNIATAYAYVADVTDDAGRPKALGLLGAAFGLGFILGPALGAALAGSGGASLARVAHGATALSVIAAIATALLLRESLTPERRAAARERPRGRLGDYLTRPGLGSLLVVTLGVFGAVAMQQTTLPLWAAAQLGLGPRTLGIVYAYVGVVAVLVQVRLIGPLSARFGSLRLVEAGILLTAAGMVLVPPAAGIPALLLSLTAFGAGNALFNPSMSALVSRVAAADERGAVLGVYQSSSSLGRVLGPLLGSALAAVATLDAVFLAGAFVLLGCVWLVARARLLAAREAG